MERKILMILSSDLLYPYLDGRVYKEAKSLVKNGFCVTVLCKGYKKGLPEVEMYNGIKIVRLLSRYSTTNSVFVLKFISYFDFILKFIWNGLKIVCDYVHCHDADTLPIGVGIKILSFKIKKLVYDTHELATKMNKPKYHEVIFTIIEKSMFRFCDIIINANDSRIEVMKRLYPKELKNKRILPIFNFPEIKELNHNEIRKTYRGEYRLRKDEIVFLYQGGLGEDYGITETIEAVNLIKNKEKIRLFVLGGGNYLTKLKNQAQNLNLEKIVIFTDYVKKEDVIKYGVIADIGLVAYKNTCLNRYYCAPNKLYEYMLAKCAVLGPIFPGMIKDIEGNEIGKTCDFSNPNDIAEKLNWFIENKEMVEKMKQGAYILVIGKYNWRKMEEKLLELYGRMINESDNKSKRD